MSNNAIDMRSEQELTSALSEADHIVFKKYMNGLECAKIKPFDVDKNLQQLKQTVHLSKIKRLVFNAEENNQHKLMNVYNAVGLVGGSIINIIISDGKKIEYYIGTRSMDLNSGRLCYETLKNVLLGNFPGTLIDDALQCDPTIELLKNIVDGNNTAVTAVGGIPAYRNDDLKGNIAFTQGIEKIIDTMHGKSFTLITISTPVNGTQIAQTINGYETLYSQLSPFSETVLSCSESESEAVADTITRGISNSVGESLSTTLSSSTTNSTSEGEQKSVTGSVNVGVELKEIFHVSGSVGTTKGSFTSVSKAIQRGETEGETHNKQRTESDSYGNTKTSTDMTGRSLQISIENKTVKDLLERIKTMIKRIEDATDLGLWNTATYCFAEDIQTSKVLASTMEALCRGDKSTVETFAIETWGQLKNNINLQNYLSHLRHPVFDITCNSRIFEVTPASLINGRELVIEAGLPLKSVPGLPVCEMTAFSRNIVTDTRNEGDKITLGVISHMGVSESTPVELNVESLSAHTLITGSTGCGKSNTVYQLLNELIKKEKKFLVIEPAKGEYKNIFGNRNDISVYGTNNAISELLRINPFQFPKKIHVLEHIDRLVEIFNACWPMYAAMPAVLKDAVLAAYEACGWDLDQSDNIYGADIYPTFKDLLHELETVLNDSAYSDEVKGNYTGSLVTRIKSLTNGINGRIFSGKIVDYSALFDNNTIIDLSRVGSSETKSLMMGFVVMSLTEYRMHQADGSMNQSFKHITVLEEAHNLLRNTSGLINDSEASGSLVGKSVEMISNSIAEMRTYGEGFIIVDQSPSAIDISAIRNTNTKIIMRLPDVDDRRQAGKSAALRDSQIAELAKLRMGVAVVYQNNWLDPVLCAINKADVKENPYSFNGSKENTPDHSDLLKMLLENRVDEHLEFDHDRIIKDIESSAFSTKTKLYLNNFIERRKILASTDGESDFSKISKVVVEILGCGNRIKSFADCGSDCALLQQELDREIERCTSNFSRELQLAISQCIVREIAEENHDRIDLYSKWREFAVSQRKLG